MVIMTEINNIMSAIIIINMLLIANPNKYTEIVKSCMVVFILARNVTFVASLFPFLAFKSLKAPYPNLSCYNYCSNKTN